MRGSGEASAKFAPRFGSCAAAARVEKEAWKTGFENSDSVYSPSRWSLQPRSRRSQPWDGDCRMDKLLLKLGASV